MSRALFSSAGLDLEVDLASGREGDGERAMVVGSSVGSGGGGGDRVGPPPPKKTGKMRGLGSLMRGLEHLKGLQPSKPTAAQSQDIAGAGGGTGGVGGGGGGGIIDVWARTPQGSGGGTGSSVSGE